MDGVQDIALEIEAEKSALEHADFGWINVVLPLPFRIGLIVVLGTWAWGFNVHYLTHLKIDVAHLITYPRPATSLPLHSSIYRLASVLTAFSGASLFLFWTLTRGDPSLVLATDHLALFYLVGLALVFVLPLPSIASNGRRRFLRMLRRVAIGGLAQPRDGKFADVLLADVMTSYAKVLADLWVCVCMFLSLPSATGLPNRSCGGARVVPIILALPSLCRLRQSLTEYVRLRNAPRREATGWGGQHLANAAKYASAIPVILFSVLQKDIDLLNQSTIY